MKAGILIDTWKLDIFTRHLKQSGYIFTQGAGIAPDTLTLVVVTDNAEALQIVVRVDKLVNRAILQPESYFIR